MKRIRLDSKSPSSLIEETVLTVGCFDGIHKGHQEILLSLLKESKKRQVPSCLCLFDPHPLTILQPQKKFKRLFTLKEIEETLKPYPLDFLCVIPFDQEFSRQTPQQFIDCILAQLHPSLMIVGYDFLFGANRTGNVEFLKEQASIHSFEVRQIPALTLGGEPVSSTRIRALLSEGKMRSVAQLLGYPFFTIGSVVKGRGRGKQLGFPTANLSTHSKSFPRRGVYAARVRQKGRWYKSVLNIGNRPTFSDSREGTLEVHVIAKNFDLYGSDLLVQWGEFLREEQAFSSPCELRRQIQKDIEKTLNINPF